MSQFFHLRSFLSPGIIDDVPTSTGRGLAQCGDERLCADDVLVLYSDFSHDALRVVHAEGVLENLRDEFAVGRLHSLELVRPVMRSALIERRRQVE